MSMHTQIDEDCVKTYSELKFDKKHRFITYKVSEEKVVSMGPLR